MEYKIVLAYTGDIGSSIWQLEGEVNTLIQQGWKPMGGICISSVGGFIQAMVNDNSVWDDTMWKEFKSLVDVILKSFDDSKKIAVIKEVREVTGLGLKEAKDLVEGSPMLLKGQVSKIEASKIMEQITAAGGIVEIISH